MFHSRKIIRKEKVRKNCLDVSRRVEKMKINALFGKCFREQFSIIQNSKNKKMHLIIRKSLSIFYS